MEGILEKLQHDSKSQAENIGTLFDAVTKNNSVDSYASMAAYLSGSNDTHKGVNGRPPVQATTSDI